MTMALDPNVGHIVQHMEKVIPTYKETLDGLQVELDEKLRSQKATLLELFHKVAIRYLLLIFTNIKN